MPSFLHALALAGPSTACVHHSQAPTPASYDSVETEKGQRLAANRRAEAGARRGAPPAAERGRVERCCFAAAGRESTGCSSMVAGYLASIA
ncbi:Os12g0214700 [Oryza sativa Japonica Group]|uniref:Os12g0214700 protein n=2 Tax=Oryza sativa subsp. japonica TaxID=39947 RepID=C7J9G1_ORYSJ|nr:Os12g0214700 [Oryza sativa Japonica Group]|eukprot:NP_001176839.1 Os12g0214700 [Oryza sativa Japonica Group]